MKNHCVKLHVVSSSSTGNSYALDADNEILLLEAGIRHSLMSKAIGFRDDKVVGCLLSHAHGDHAKYAEEYSRRGIMIICNQDVADKKKLETGRKMVFQKPLETFSVGSFQVCPIPLAHDVPCHGFLIHHDSMGTFMFVTDTFKIDCVIAGVDHFLIEANYSDELLKKNVWNGKIEKTQADRIMLSHMSLEYTIKYLRDCKAEKSAKTITLCHLSERNSDHDTFRDTVAGAFGVPTFIAQKGSVIELNKEVI